MKNTSAIQPDYAKSQLDKFTSLLGEVQGAGASSYNTMMEKEYYFCAYFVTKQDKEEFLRLIGMRPSVTFIDGHLLAERVNVKMPNTSNQANLPPPFFAWQIRRGLQKSQTKTRTRGKDAIKRGLKRARKE